MAISIPVCAACARELTKVDNGACCVRCDRTFDLDAILTEKRGGETPWGDPRASVEFATRVLGKARATEYFDSRVWMYEKSKTRTVGDVYVACQREMAGSK